jgi:hypothetical protein
MSPPSAAELDRDAILSGELAAQGVSAFWQWVRTAEGAMTMLAIATLWIISRPYVGIIHDSRLYTLQALAHVDHTRYADDLYLKFGSQDNFSIFAPLLAQALRWTTPATANLILTLAGEALWLTGAIAFVSVLLKSPRDRAFALGAIIALPAGYGGEGVFSYAEPFLTPRIFAEALTLLAFASTVRRRWLYCVASCAAALAMHPLIALCGIIFIFCWIAVENRRWWLLPAAGFLLVVALAWMDVEPFVRLRTTLSGEWLSVVFYRCSFAFLGRWNIWDYVHIISQLAIVAVALPYSSAFERRLLKATAATVTIGLLATGLGADLLHNLFFLNIQPWRALWLLSLIVNFTAGLTLLRLQTSTAETRWYFAAGLAIYWLTPVLAYVSAPAAACLILAAAFHGAERRGWATKKLVVYTVFVGTTVSVVAALGLAAMAFLVLAKYPDNQGLSYGRAVTPLLVAASVFLIIHWQRAALAFAAVAFLLAASAYDRLTPWDKFVYQSDVPAELAVDIGTAKNIYWEQGVELTWFRLGRPAYYSCLQGSGVMFYRQTALEYERRGKALAALNTSDFGSDDKGFCAAKADTEAVRPRSPADIISACDALPELDMLVLLSKVDDLPATSWETPAPRYRVIPGSAIERVDRYYFYDCRKLRGL